MSFEFRNFLPIITLLKISSHSANCTRIILSAHLSYWTKKIFSDFWCNLRRFSKIRKYMMWVQLPRCENGILNGSFDQYYISRSSKDVASIPYIYIYIHPSKFDFSSVFPFNDKGNDNNVYENDIDNFSV